MRLIFLIAFPLILAGCAHPPSSLNIENEYTSGNLRAAEIKATASINREMPKNNYQQSNNAVWMLLDRATIRFAAGNTCAAIEDFELAIEAMDYYNQDLWTETAAQILGDDNNAAYKGEDFEQALARFYFALALLHEGDESNAYAVLRQAEELYQKKKCAYSCNPITEQFYLDENPLSKVLFAALLEKIGDRSNALILKKEAERISGLRLPESKTRSCKVVLICHNGNAPIKVNTYSDASRASALALELILGSQGITPAVCDLTGIPVPELTASMASIPTATYAKLNGWRSELNAWYDVGRSAALELEKKIPVILARGAARMLIRRSAVGYMQNQDPFLGSLTDFGMLIANSMTNADTRSWGALPMTIDFAIFEVDPGEYPLEIFSKIKSYCFSSSKYNLRLKQGDLCVVNIFNIHPGIVRILIPDRFLSKI